MRGAGEYLAAASAHFARIRIKVAAPPPHPSADPLTPAEGERERERARERERERRGSSVYWWRRRGVFFFFFLLSAHSQGASCLSYHDFLITSHGSRRELTATGPPAEFYIREGAERITKGSHLEIMKRSEMPTPTAQGAVGIVWGGGLTCFEREFAGKTTRPAGCRGHASKQLSYLFIYFLQKRAVRRAHLQ